MILNTEINIIGSNLNLPLSNQKYLCQKCNYDNPFYGPFDKEDWYLEIQRIPYKNKLELSFWAKCPKCGNPIYLGRTE